MHITVAIRLSTAVEGVIIERVIWNLDPRSIILPYFLFPSFDKIVDKLIKSRRFCGHCELYAITASNAWNMIVVTIGSYHDIGVEDVLITQKPGIRAAGNLID